MGDIRRKGKGATVGTTTGLGMSDYTQGKSARYVECIGGRFQQRAREVRKQE